MPVASSLSHEHDPSLSVSRCRRAFSGTVVAWFERKNVFALPAGQFCTVAKYNVVQWISHYVSLGFFFLFFFQVVVVWLVG